MTAPGTATFPQLLLSMPASAAASPRSARRTSASGRPGPGSACATRSRGSPAGWRRRACKRGEHLAVIGANRPRLYCALTAAQSLGAIPVPFYEDAPAHGDDLRLPERRDRVRDRRGPGAGRQALRDPAAVPEAEAHLVRRAARPAPLRAARARELREPARRRAQAYAKANPGFFEGEIAQGRCGRHRDHAVHLGNHGQRRRAWSSRNDNLIQASRAYAELEGLRDDEEVLAYLPMAWIGQNLFSYAQWMYVGFRINCPESAETVLTDMREIGPTYYFAPPRVLEALLTQVTIRMEDAGWVKRSMFHALHGPRAPRGRAHPRRHCRWPRRTACSTRWAGSLVYGPLRNSLGMSRVRVAYTAGEAIGPDLFVFYRSLGINLKQLYGSTETSVMVCVQPNGAVQARHRGPADEGRGGPRARLGRDRAALPGALPRVLQERRPRRARPRTPRAGSTPGDAGFFDAAGHLKIIDRAKDVGKLSDGTLFAPEVPREQAQVLPPHQGGGGLRRRPRRRPRRWSTSTCRRWATGPSAAASRTRATPTSRPSRRWWSWSASAWRR